MPSTLATVAVAEKWKENQAVSSQYIGLLKEEEAEGSRIRQDQVLYHENASTYQQLLTTMVSNISSVLLLEDPNYDDASCTEENMNIHGLSSHRAVLLTQHFKNQMQNRILLHSEQIPTPSRFSISSVDPLHYLGITPTTQSGELLQAFIKLITKYVVSIDGCPGPNYYNDYWVPWSVKSPLLANLGIFTASCYQAEIQKISPKRSPVVLRYKCDALNQLNVMLSKKETAICNEAIAAVVILIINEWYWSGHDTVQSHMNGLKEIVRLRGGLGELGMNDFLRQMILLTDYHIAICYKSEPNFPHNVRPLGQYPVHMSTPFVRSPIKFSSIAAELSISAETASILDDMQFLLLALLHHVDREISKSEKNKLRATSIWIKDLILTSSNGTEVFDPLAGDHIYKSCRIAALIYCRAIVEKTSLSQACTLRDLNHLWASMWKITLKRWKQIPGIFLFIILAAIPAAQDTPHGRFLKSMLKTTTSYISIDHWDVADNCLMAHVKLQRWLRAGARELAGSSEPDPLEFIHLYES